ncbi:MAG: c-type cytochrome [Proteobacteria bacterium]|nr:c-type cytochrome [Pseudomonadota bacterium]
MRIDLINGEMNMSLGGSLKRGLLLVALMPLAFGASPTLGADRTGQQVVAETCGNCHATGEKGAPKLGDKNAWAKRASQGLSELTQHALKGIREMPPHGGAANLSDHEIQLAITYMVNQSGGKWIEPTNKAVPAVARTGEQIVKLRCFECHQAGLNGAPKIGDRDAWTARVKRGLDLVVGSAIHGHGAMPARGGLPDLTDAEIRNAVIYMFTQSTAPQKK